MSELREGVIVEIIGDVDYLPVGARLTVVGLDDDGDWECRAEDGVDYYPLPSDVREVQPPTPEAHAIAALRRVAEVDTIDKAEGHAGGLYWWHLRQTDAPGPEKCCGVRVEWLDDTATSGWRSLVFRGPTYTAAIDALAAKLGVG